MLDAIITQTQYILLKLNITILNFIIKYNVNYCCNEFFKNYYKQKIKYLKSIINIKIKNNLKNRSKIFKFLKFIKKT